MKRYITLLTAVALSLAGCAKTEDPDRDTLEDTSLEAWMQMYHGPQLADGTIVKLESGMYYQWLSDNPGTGRKPDLGDWVMVNYRGTTLRGDVFLTRYEEEARREGSYTAYCHYTPHYMMYSQAMDLTPGEIEALGLMALGDSIRLYMPSKLGYYEGTSFEYAYGYEGSTVSIGQIPVIIDLVLKEIIVDEYEYQREQVISKAMDWGLAPADSLKYDLYMDFVETDEEAAAIHADSAVYLHFSGYFMDGFLISTNVDSVAQAHWEDYSAYYPRLYNVRSGSVSDDYPTNGFFQIFSSGKVRYNSTIRVTFTSDWGYGYSGKAATATRPIIYPYVPLVYEITTMPYEYDPNEDQ